VSLEFLHYGTAIKRTVILRRKLATHNK